MLVRLFPDVQGVLDGDIPLIVLPLVVNNASWFDAERLVEDVFLVGFCLLVVNLL
jgi:hypothetical protein